MTHKARIEKLEQALAATQPSDNPYMTMPKEELLQVARDYLQETADQPTNPTREYIAARLAIIEEARHES